MGAQVFVVLNEAVSHESFEKLSARKQKKHVGIAATAG